MKWAEKNFFIENVFEFFFYSFLEKEMYDNKERYQGTYRSNDGPTIFFSDVGFGSEQVAPPFGVNPTFHSFNIRTWVAHLGMCRHIQKRVPHPRMWDTPNVTTFEKKKQKFYRYRTNYKREMRTFKTKLAKVHTKSLQHEFENFDNKRLQRSLTSETCQ